VDSTSVLGLIVVLSLAVLSLALLLYGLIRGLRRGVDLIDVPRFEQPLAGPDWVNRQAAGIKRRRSLAIGCSLALVLLAAACLIYAFLAALL
jgi:hypothetical protein